MIRGTDIYWPRVNRQHPCDICGKIDWCTYKDDGSGCMRVESPVPMRNGGWWHPNDSQVRERYVPPAKSVPGNTLIDCEALLRKWRGSQKCQIEPFAATLGVSPEALRALGCVWAGEHRAFAFPMVNAQRRVIGIRLRNERGEKWAVKSSRSGLFMNLSGGLSEPEVQSKGDLHINRNADTWNDSDDLPPKSGALCGKAGKPSSLDGDKDGSDKFHALPAQLLIVEGPTDTAAAIDLGFGVVGRPACLGCEDMIVQVAKQYPRVRLIIIADADAPGQRGARSLQERGLRKAKIVTLPAKDLRQFVQLGGNRKLLNEILAASL